MAQFLAAPRSDPTRPAWSPPRNAHAYDVIRLSIEELAPSSESVDQCPSGDKRVTAQPSNQPFRCPRAEGCSDPRVIPGRPVLAQFEFAFEALNRISESDESTLNASGA